MVDTATKILKPLPLLPLLMLAETATATTTTFSSPLPREIPTCNSAIPLPLLRYRCSDIATPGAQPGGGGALARARLPSASKAPLPPGAKAPAC